MSGWQPLAFGVCAGATVVTQVAFFIVAFTLKFDKVTDLAGCANFILLALLTLLMEPEYITVRKIVITALVCVSRLELGSYLLYRVLKRGRDARFDEYRARCLAFFCFWVYQMVWVFAVSAPLIFINTTRSPDPALSWVDWLGWSLFCVGLVIQVSADISKQRFRSDGANAMRVCDVGLWYFSRHPNFFGEILMWWGVFVGGLPIFIHMPSGFATIVSPLFTMWVLLCLSGIPTAEGSNAKRWYDGGESQERYQAYFASTPPLILFPPACYRPLPLVIKRLLCFELPQYEYRPDLQDALTADEHAVPVT